MTAINLGIRQRESLLEPLEAAVWLLDASTTTQVTFRDAKGNFCAVGALAAASHRDEYAPDAFLDDLKRELFYAIPREKRDAASRRAVEVGYHKAKNVRHYTVVTYNDSLDKDGVVEWASFALSKVRARCG